MDSVGNGHEEAQKTPSTNSCVFLCLFVATDGLILGCTKYGRCAPPRRNVAELRCPIAGYPARAARVSSWSTFEDVLHSGYRVRGCCPSTGLSTTHAPHELNICQSCGIQPRGSRDGIQELFLATRISAWRARRARRKITGKHDERLMVDFAPCLPVSLSAFPGSCPRIGD